MILVSEMLHYVVHELNKATRFVYADFNAAQGENNTFDLLLNCFDGIDQYEAKEQSEAYEQLFGRVTANAQLCNSNVREEKSFRFMIIRLHFQRLFSLKKMFKELQKFLSESMHVCIGKAFSLSLIVQIFSINFLLDDEVLEFLHLESICYCLTSQL